jgi:predicted NUDIX family phosphoesterase
MVSILRSTDISLSFWSPVITSSSPELRPRRIHRSSNSSPYVVVTAGEKILHYRRGSGSGETRLLKKGSVGIGGHINDGDGLGEAFDRAAYQRALMRELQEELAIESCFIERPLALLNDDTNPVGAVHLGIVHQCHLAEDNVKANEEAIAELGFLTLDELSVRHEDLETWSQLVVGGWKGLRTIG